MKAQELRQKSLQELQKMLKDSREKVFEYKISKVQNRLKKPNLLKNAQKDIARVLTIINQKMQS
ncbi:MAG: 50S ribosomal protein L29 [Patescibacteria group bacterium]